MCPDSVPAARGPYGIRTGERREATTLDSNEYRARERERWANVNVVDTVGPLLDFDQTPPALQDLVGHSSTVNVQVADRGVPFAEFSGCLNRVDVIADDVYQVTLRPERIDNDTRKWHEGPGNTLTIRRGDFRGAGESDDVQRPGPLAIDCGPVVAVLLAPGVTPDWSRYRSENSGGSAASRDAQQAPIRGHAQVGRRTPPPRRTTST